MNKTTLVLPLPPNMLNSRRNWRVQLRAKKAYWQRCDILRLALPKPPATPPERIRATATLYVWALMDDDNAMARIKWAADWIVAQGYVADDRKKNIEWAGLPHQVVDRKAQRLEITIEPIAESEAA